MTRYWPLRKGTFTIGSPFGPRAGGFHAGQDFPAPDGTPIHACAAGTIIHLGAAAGYGQWIVIDHPAAEGGGVSEYGHMWDARATGLSVGDWVEAGQVIGYVGNNGQSSGPHLHLSVMPYGYDPAAKVDPLSWLRGAGYPGGFLWALGDDEQRELLDRTRQVWEQLRGPEGRGWPQLGRGARGEDLSFVDALAEVSRAARSRGATPNAQI
ncbi:M23 family metallopeptidase [Nocardia sp. CDC159]|uniref:M23 family metallopeptidase n=1 Tax=Nocardia pulmonis TaxID=2951408 RepID=A0A9X2EEK4_9NOCA|nr:MULTISPECIES: M23 family metallopeptidase [Nocardia]MCM6779044.1 M23 family metallopeptidase [Nocardia pulmonis]MCM6791934.1 M23 family metallopeptidase [Nocardia sp. CDC159]